MLKTAQARSAKTEAQCLQAGRVRGVLVSFVVAIILLAGTGVVRAQVRTRLQAVSASTHRVPREVVQGNIQQRHKRTKPANLSAKARARLVATYAKLPLSFEANKGQTTSQVKFISRGPGYALFLMKDEAVLTLNKVADDNQSREADPQFLPAGNDLSNALEPILGFATLEAKANPGTKTGRKGENTGAVVQMQLIGANPSAVITGADELPGRSNYLIGNNPQKWHTNVPTYAKVRYEGVYPGVDLVYYGNPNKGGELENDFVVAPGADPAVIGLSIKGADHLSLDADGDLVIAAGGGKVLLRKPVIYQEGGTEGPSAEGNVPGRQYIPGQYKLGTSGQISFKIGAYDSSKSLIIDPVLSYSTYLGGSSLDVGTRVAVDSAGDAYVTGLTSSADFPNTAGTVDQTIGSQTCGVLFSRQPFPCPDAFVTKLSPDGKTILYSTFLGGLRGDGATGITVDSSGNVFLTGFTSSLDFPVTSGAFQTTLRGESDAFVSKLNSTGTSLLYSTLVGGSKDDISMGIATDSTGNSFITGVTFSGNFPATQGSAQATMAVGSCTSRYSAFPFACPDAFVAELNSAGSALTYATYLGGGSYDAATSIALDSGGSAYVTGVTTSTNFPTTASTYQGSTSGATCGPPNTSHPCTQAFVTKLSPTGDSRMYSTYFGGNGDTAGIGIAVDSSGSAYITGLSNASDLPTTGQSFAMGACGSATNSFNCPDAFIAKLNSAGSALSYMTYLGGTSYDFATDVRVDGSGDAYVVGATGSLDFPVTGSPVQSMFGGGSCDMNLNGTIYNIHCPNAFLTVLGPTGSPFFSTFLGGAGGDAAFGVAVDSASNAYLSGTTVSSDFPVVNAVQPQLAGQSEAFVAKISGLSTPAGTAILSPSTLSFNGVAVGDSSSSQDVTLSNTGGGSLSVNGISITGADSGDFSQTTTCSNSLAAGSSCTISVTFTPTAAGSRSATLSVSDSAASSPQTASLSGTGQDFTLTARTTSQTIAAGGAATYDLLLSPQSGFNQAINLSCSGAPNGATCTVQPTSVTLDGTNDAAFSVKVTTTGNAVAVPRGPGDFVPPSGNLPLIQWLAFILLLGLVAAVWRGKKGSPIRWSLPFVTLAVFVTLWVACGGGSSSTPSNSNSTPAGTYTLTVTGTAGNLQHTTDLTLKVQ